MIDTDDGFAAAARAPRARQIPPACSRRYEGAPLSFRRPRPHGERAGASGCAGIGLAPGDAVALMLRNSPLAFALLFAIAQGARRLGADQRAEPRREPRLHLQSFRAEADHRRGGAHRHDRRPAARRLPARSSSPPKRCRRSPRAAMRPPGTRPRPRPTRPSRSCTRPAPPAAQRACSSRIGCCACRARRSALVSAARAGDVMFMWEPLYHIGGAQMIVLPLIRDVTLALVEHFSASRFWSQVREHGATHIHFLGGILQILLKQPPSALDRTHGARIAWGGGCPREIWRPFEQRFGIQIRECYGMTECSSITTYNDNGTLGAVGKPTPWFSVDAARRRRARRCRPASAARSWCAPRCRARSRAAICRTRRRPRARCAATPSIPATSARSMPTATCISTAA